MTQPNRRACLQTMLALGAGVGGAATWPHRLAAKMKSANTGRKLIVLWMPGGPSQLDTFDLKPGHENGGEFKELQTSVPGMRFSEHLPQLAKQAEHLALVRSMQTKEGDHSRGTYLIRTGQRPGAPLRYPSLPAALAKELSSPYPNLPGYVSILPNTFINPAAFGSGFLGASREPLTVAGTASFDPQQSAADDSQTADEPVNLRVDNLLPPENLVVERLRLRREFWELLQESYGARRRVGAPATHDTVYRRAMELAESELVAAFDLKQESTATRERYGNDSFGQGCLMARRLIERDVSVVEVSLSDGPGGLSWDSHADNFSTVQRLSERLDRSWSQLMLDLASSGLLEQTTIVWMGEFGRTPKINENAGRDHFPNAWTCVLAGAGIQGGSIVGATSSGGQEVTDRPVAAADFLATLCRAVGVDPDTENMAEDRRPIKLVEGVPLHEILA
ncbi:DUF1501 domain-containing protein [Aureliella helgolandensis]|uniref:DUF1501 domain-containing protein n=1 Tax=Aureliella helgolandensis TaxID=2527968 RepID=A0A518GGJ8_9BACT|nr:DUF1501 domain-containing protein [Aureliella helgolandensis]QDV27725.1 hypothetical protein Q31a_61180 [Aureliella helgolandensis]